MGTRRFYLVLVIVALVVIAIDVARLASFKQNRCEAWIRRSGGKLAFWLPLEAAAKLHLPYAWAAVAVYQDSIDPIRKPLTISSECPEPHAYLVDLGWTQWQEIPQINSEGTRDSAAYKMRKVHLRAEVWSSKSEGKVIVAFGGTAAASLEDWKSNLRWLRAPLDVLPAFMQVEDAYDVVTKIFVGTFAKAYLARASEAGNDWMRSAQVIATGHSLGAGLAERFAYSLNKDYGVPLVKEVYAFDPTPVSGKRSVPRWWEQAKGLTIYRIYNRGEILASIRSLFALAENPPEGQGQKWIDVRYLDNWTWRTLLPSGWVHAHAMFDFACFLKRGTEPSFAESASRCSRATGKRD